MSKPPGLVDNTDVQPEAAEVAFDHWSREREQGNSEAGADTWSRMATPSKATHTHIHTLIFSTPSF